MHPYVVLNTRMIANLPLSRSDIALIRCVKPMGRRKTRKISVGTVEIGADAPIAVQSMTKTDTRDVEATLRQISSLVKSGCEIVRVAIPDDEAATAFGKIKRRTFVPLVADIHFNHILAIKAIENGADCVRINPGNIGGGNRLKQVIDAAAHHGISLRIGVNAGSLEKDILEKYGKPGPEALFASAERHVRFFESRSFFDFKLSLKASDVQTTVEANRLFSSAFDYPLHVGVTEAGTIFAGTVKSSAGIGILLHEGIGDTIRVSLTAPPEEEVRVAYEILKSLGLRRRGPEIISCPTCGRIEVDIEKIIEGVEKRITHIDKHVKVAVMGCVVNGPGEASEADVGVACGKGTGLIFVRGEVMKRVSEEEIVPELVSWVEKVTREDIKGGI